MFVTQGLTVGTGLREAQARLTNLLHGAWLTEASTAAYNGTLTGMLRVGPPGLAAAKLVRVSLLDPVYRGGAMTVGLRWEATGAAGSLFPVLDANISISPGQHEGTASGNQTARLALTGSYRPPLGRLGAALDQAVLHRVATATISALLQDLAAALTSPAPTGHPAKDVSPSWSAILEPGMP